MKLEHLVGAGWNVLTTDREEHNVGKTFFSTYSGLATPNDVFSSLVISSWDHFTFTEWDQHSHGMM